MAVDTDRLVIQNEEDEKLKSQLEQVDFHLDYGSVKIQIRNLEVKCHSQP